MTEPNNPTPGRPIEELWNEITAEAYAKAPNDVYLFEPHNKRHDPYQNGLHCSAPLPGSVRYVKAPLDSDKAMGLMVDALEYYEGATRVCLGDKCRYEKHSCDCYEEADGDTATKALSDPSVQAFIQRRGK